MSTTDRPAPTTECVRRDAVASIFKVKEGTNEIGFATRSAAQPGEWRLTTSNGIDLVRTASSLSEAVEALVEHETWRRERAA